MATAALANTASILVVVVWPVANTTTGQTLINVTLLSLTGSD
jgi:hypothetical protein